MNVFVIETRCLASICVLGSQWNWWVRCNLVKSVCVRKQFFWSSAENPLFWTSWRACFTVSDSVPQCQVKHVCLFSQLQDNSYRCGHIRSHQCSIYSVTQVRVSQASLSVSVRVLPAFTAAVFSYSCDPCPHSCFIITILCFAFLSCISLFAFCLLFFFFLNCNASQFWCV